MSTVTYRHEDKLSYKKKGVKHLYDISIIDGELGLSFILTVKEGEKFHRINVKETGKDKFTLKENNGTSHPGNVVPILVFVSSNGSK